VWSLRLRERLYTIAHPGAQSSIREVTFSPDGEIMVTSAGGELRGNLAVWETKSGTQLATLNDDVFAYGCAFSADGRTLVAGSLGGGFINMWDRESGWAFAILQPVTAKNILLVATSPHEPRLAFATFGQFGGEVYTWDWRTDSPHPLPGNARRQFTAFLFSPSGDRLYAGDVSGNLSIWDDLQGNSEAQVQQLDSQHHAALMGIALSPDGNILAVAFSNSSFGIWAVDQWQQPSGVFGGPSEEARRNFVLFTPDQKSIITNGVDGFPHLWGIQP
jgi:WD40 repeat protein